MNKKILLFLLMIAMAGIGLAQAQTDFEIDIIKTEVGDLEIWCIGHGTVMLKLNDAIIHVDPVSREADYSMLPVADLILVTHEHGDHLDKKAIFEITKSSTQIFCNKESVAKLDMPLATSICNGEELDVHISDQLSVKIEAVPAYNIKHERSPGEPFHKRGVGNGYIISIAGKRIYIAGDTENIPEMADIKDIDVAFLPMNLPYTMSPEMAALAARSFMPGILYPYHFGSTDTNKLLELLGDSGIEVRIRNF